MPVIKLTSKQNVLNNITFTKPYLNKKNSRITCYMLYDGEPFSIRLPTMLKAPFGACQIGAKGEGSGTYSLNVCAYPLNKNKKDVTDEFFTALETLDEMLVKLVLENSELIFGKGKKYKVGEHEPIVQALQTLTVKTGENKEGVPYPKRLQAKIRGMYETPDRPNVQVYVNSSKEDINNESFIFENLLELIPQGTFVDMICQPNIWFINGRFGITWNVRQIKVNESKKESLKSYAFSDDDNDNNSDDDENSDDAENSDDDNNSDDDENSDDEEVNVSS